MNHNNSLNIILEIIQPKWLIEEKAISLRKEIWFNPPNLPKIIDIQTIKIIK